MVDYKWLKQEKKTIFGLDKKCLMVYWYFMEIPTVNIWR